MDNPYAWLMILCAFGGLLVILAPLFAWWERKRMDRIKRERVNRKIVWRA